MKAAVIGFICIALGLFIAVQVNHGGPFYVALAAVLAYWVFRLFQKRGLIRIFLNEPKKAIAVLIVWTTLNAGFWIFFGRGDRGYFFPFSASNYDNFMDPRYYGLQEFFVYGVLPWAAYAVYRLLKDKKA